MTEYQVLYDYLMPAFSRLCSTALPKHSSAKRNAQHPLWSINGADHNFQSPSPMSDSSCGFGAHLMADSSDKTTPFLEFPIPLARKMQSDLG